MPFLIKTAQGDEDLMQEGAIGIWQSMMKKPEGANRYYATKAKWNIQTVKRGIGKSVDIPKWYKRQTPISIVHYDATPYNSNTQLSQAILPDRKHVPLDELVIQKLDFEGFLDSISLKEAGYIHLKMVVELPDAEVAKRMNVSIQNLHAMKKELRGKIEDYFDL